MTTSSTETFLADVDARTWALPDKEKPPEGIEPKLWFRGRGSNPLEVAYATASQKPKAEMPPKLWKARWKNRANPVLVVVAYPERDGTARATLCGPGGESPPRGAPI